MSATEPLHRLNVAALRIAGAVDVDEWLASHPEAAAYGAHVGAAA